MGAVIISDRVVEGTRGHEASLRPDIVLRNTAANIITMVDICVPFENRSAAIEAARSQKLRKYAALADQLRQDGYRVNVAAFVVGALGAWESRNEKTMKLLDINKYYARMMRRFMIRSSGNIILLY